MESIEESSGIIDDEGNLFGVVNIVDALVVVLVLAVIVAGVSLVLTAGSDSDSSATEGTTNVTLDLGSQPEYVISQISIGDSYSPAGDSTLRITDIYVTPQGESTRAVVRAELSAPRSEDTLQYNGAPPRYGRQIEIQTDTYSATGTIREVGGSSEVTTTETEVLARANLSETEARQLSAGQSILVDGREAATIESVTTYGTENPDKKTVFLGLTLQTLSHNDKQEFGETTVRAGAGLSLPTDAGLIEGEIIRVGTTSQRGQPATRNVQLQVSGVSPLLAESITPGMTESFGGETTARITEVQRENATVVIRGQEGDIYERDHPVQQDVTFTANLSVRETEAGVTFKGQTLQQGRVITLDLGTVTIRATVVSGYQ
ncbi:hypothetical protein Harman_12050 [Haloarcula mannanilytica]|uniref:DUF4330 domain-containing protein n=1 Tax=Haloarcula mannanilytica TaxID=2509225 RepID=A0A4C2EIU9_9EURY|nr:DUF4330 family protein [Haloarcula mannanilytica]GCF13270.1 hypothetical protein Harman_12050 [Haloarcula mannanilytica]